MGPSLHSAWCRVALKTKEEILNWIKGTESPLSSSRSIGDLKTNLHLGSTEDGGEKSQGHGEIRQGPGLWLIFHIVVYPREQNEDEKQVQVKSTLLRNEHAKWGESKSAGRAFSELGRTGHGYLSRVMRHFLESSVGRRGVHVMPRANLTPWLQREPEFVYSQTADPLHFLYTSLIIPTKNTFLWPKSCHDICPFPSLV